MNYTTTTKIARQGKKAFEGITYSTVLYNNQDIGMIIGKELADALENSGILQQIKEELWEASFYNRMLDGVFSEIDEKNTIVKKENGKLDLSFLTK